MGSWSFYAPGQSLYVRPPGLLSCSFVERPRWWKSALIGFCASAFVEVFQLFLPRSSDINDIILNTFGALCGFWLYLLLRRLSPGRQPSLNAGNWRSLMDEILDTAAPA